MRTEEPALQEKADPSWRIAIVHSSYYPEEIAHLVRGARGALLEAGIPESHILVQSASGSFEVPLLASALARSGTVDAIVALGIIVEGETHHASLIAREAARGLMDVQLQLGIPCAFEILYANTLALVRARLGKGREAALASLHSLSVLKRIRG